MTWWETVGELLLPCECAGCGRAGAVLCARCRHALREPPHLVRRPRDIGTPVWALGDYTRMRRRLIISMKEYNNVAVRAHLGAVLAAGMDYLRARGDLPWQLHLVPAPTRARSARQRGGDPVLHMCQAAARVGEALHVVPCVSLDSRSADQTHLGAYDRWSNTHGSVRVAASAQLQGRDVIIVDDVVTTGATLAATTAALRVHGAVVRGAVVLADAH